MLETNHFLATATEREQLETLLAAGYAPAWLDTLSTKARRWLFDGIVVELSEHRLNPDGQPAYVCVLPAAPVEMLRDLSRSERTELSRDVEQFAEIFCPEVLAA